MDERKKADESESVFIGLRIKLALFHEMEKLRNRLRRGKTNFVTVAIEQFIKRGGKIE